MSQSREIDDAAPVCGATGCRDDAAVRVVLPDGRQRVVCVDHVQTDTDVISHV